MSRNDVLEAKHRFGLYDKYIGVATEYGYGVFTSKDKIKECLGNEIYLSKSFSRPNKAENYALNKLIKMNFGIYCRIPRLENINEFRSIDIKPFTIDKAE